MSNPPLPHTIVLPSGGVVMIDRLALPSAQEGDGGKGRQDGRDRRLAERSTWHRVARTLLNNPTAQFDYNEVGAPQIIDSPLHISVSHSSHLVAVIVSPQRCAIDIERLSRNFEGIASRYISPLEESSLCQTANYKAHIWSIKESLYKYSGRKELDMLDDLRVISLPDSGFTGSIAPHSQPIEGERATLHDHTLSYIG